MNPIHIIETQSTDAQFMSCLPKACGDRPYEIIDNQVIVHDEDKKIIITVHHEPIRHLGSLELPMEEIIFEFDGYSQEQADKFMSEYRKHTMRAGGG
ncbi:MAG: hypothetical protein ACI9XK_001712 [Granulosicoccus sp.]|jgi:hypothetical protein